MRRFVVVLVLLVLVVGLMPAHTQAQTPNNTITATVSVPATLAVRSVGTLTVDRSGTSKTVLVDGNVLLAGGSTYDASRCPVSDAEIYNATTGKLESVGDLLYGRGPSKTTLLADGRVLFESTDVSACGAGNANPTTQVYNPAKRVFEPTPSTLPRPALYLGNGGVLAYNGRGIQFCRPLVPSCAVGGKLTKARTNFAATRLLNGDVLMTGGTEAVTNAETYTPSTGAVALAGVPTTSIGTPGIVLADGRIFFADAQVAELYDPVARSFTAIPTGGEYLSGSKFRASDGNVVILNGEESFVVYYPATNSFTRYDGFYGIYASMAVPNGDILFVTSDYRTTDGNRVTGARYVAANTFTGSLTYPLGWTQQRIVPLGVQASSTLAPVAEVGLETIHPTKGRVITWTPYSTVSPTIDLLMEGALRPATLLLRDANGATATITSASINYDQTAPTAQASALPAFSRRNFVVRWSGTDAVSGIVGYDVEMRTGLNGTWQRIATNVKKTTAAVTGTHGQQLFFRARARDAAGNVKAWASTYDTQTIIDNVAPTGTATTTIVSPYSIRIESAAMDQDAGVTHMRVAHAYQFDDAPWQPYSATSYLERTGTAMDCVPVVAQFRDGAGNLSPIVQVPVQGADCP